MRVFHLLAGILAAVSLGFGAAQAEGFPEKAVTLVVPFSPGGNSDIVGRALGQKLSELWRQPVIVENKPGATTTIGAAYAAKAAPDGYTILLAPPPFVITQYVYPNLTYDTRKSFQPISLVAYYPLIMVARTNLPVKSLKELVDYAMKHPGTTYSSPGQGSTPHLAGELLARESKLDLVHVPYKSGGQAVLDVIAGRIDFYAGPPSEVVSHIKAGKLTPVAVFSSERSKLLPDLSTSKEQGFPYLKVQSWTSIAAPAGTPKNVAEKISRDIAKVITEPSLRDPLLARGAIFVGSTPEELAAFYEEEHKRFGPIVKSLGLKP